MPILERVPGMKLRGAAALAAKLLAHKETAYLARRLTGIVCDVPLDCSLDELKPRAPDNGSPRGVFRHARLRQYFAPTGAAYRGRTDNRLN